MEFKQKQTKTRYLKETEVKFTQLLQLDDLMSY